MKLGVDVETVSRFKKFTRASAFVRRYFSADEIAYCFSKSALGRAQSLAARFACKEAYFKATQSRLPYAQIEALPGRNGAPYLRVNGRRVKGSRISLSHSAHCAYAAVILP